MIKIIGFKRLIVLTILIAINAALAAGIYMYLLPENAKTDRELTAVKRQVSGVRSDINKMQIEFEQLEEQQDKFDNLKDTGFFSTQVRSEAKLLFSQIQEDSNVLSATVSVKSGVIETNEEAQKSNHKVLMSPVELEIESLDDIDVYRYLVLLQQRFPGHLSLDRITMKRNRDLSKAVLRSIASGASPELVSANVRMSWRTIIPENQVIAGTEADR